MIEARLQGSILQSNAASYVTNEKTWGDDNIRPSDWYQVDNYTVRFSLSIPPNENGYNNFITACGMSVSYSGGAELEYYVKLNYGSVGTYIESSWKSVNELQHIVWDWRGHSYNNNCTIQFYVRKVDQSTISLGSFRRAGAFVYGYNDVPLDIQVTQTTAIPSDWFDNTTQTYQTVTTVSRPSEYDDLVGTVPALTPDIGGTPPSWFEQFNPMEQPWFVDIISSLADFTDIVTSVASQMQIFWVFGGFVITGLLLAWLLH